MLFRSVLDIQSFLEHLSEAERLAFEESVTKTRYAKGQVVFYEQAMPFGIYVLASGKVKLYKTGDEGKNQIFQLCIAGDMFGFHAALQDASYPDSAATLEDCEVHFIPKQFFLDLVKGSTRLSFFLLQRLSQEFRDFIEQETMLSQKPVRARVASVIHSLYFLYVNEEQCCVIPLSRNDLADLCGTVKETLVRMLRELKDEGLIRSENGRDIEVLDLERLKRVGNC